jgi:integral membrane sensor domain MASE1
MLGPIGRWNGNKPLVRQPAQPRIRQVIAFFAAAGLGAAVSALIGAFCAVHVLTDENYFHQWRVWWAGNWMGSLEIAPVALTWRCAGGCPIFQYASFAGWSWSSPPTDAGPQVYLAHFSGVLCR